MGLIVIATRVPEYAHTYIQTHIHTKMHTQSKKQQKSKKRGKYRQKGIGKRKKNTLMQLWEERMGKWVQIFIICEQDKQRQQRYSM